MVLWYDLRIGGFQHQVYMGISLINDGLMTVPSSNYTFEYFDKFREMFQIIGNTAYAPPPQMVESQIRCDFVQRGNLHDNLTNLVVTAPLFQPLAVNSLDSTQNPNVRSLQTFHLLSAILVKISHLLLQSHGFSGHMEVSWNGGYP